MLFYEAVVGKHGTQCPDCAAAAVDRGPLLRRYRPSFQSVESAASIPEALFGSLQALARDGLEASTRVRAAESILSHAAKAIEIEDIEARVAALEQAASNGTRR